MNEFTQNLTTQQAVNKQDSLRVDIINASAVSQDFYVRALIIRPTGDLVEFAQLYTVTPGNFTNAQYIGLTDGYLLDITCELAGSASQGGEYFIRFTLIQGTVDQIARHVPLLSGYPTYDRPLKLRQQNNLDTAALLNTPIRFSADPIAAGQSYEYNDVTNSFTRLHAFGMIFVASAAAANRNFQIDIIDTSAQIYRYRSLTNMTAGQTYQISGIIGQSAPADGNNNVYIPVPPKLDTQTIVLRFTIINIQAADQLSNIEIVWGRVAQV